MRARQQGRRGRAGRLLTVAGLVAAAVTATVAVAVGAASKTVAISDPKGDVREEPDIQRAQLGLASDGRVRVVITLAKKVDPRALLAGSGPPGSVCVKIWTERDADPAATAPDRLVCVTARTADDLRASVLQQTAAGLPRHAAPAAVGTNESGRSLIVRFAQSALGRPELIRFAVESTSGGCPRVSCTDQAPDAGAVRRFRLR